MSYDLDLQKDGVTVELAEKHDLRGGTYCLGGTTEASLNITYNYWEHFTKVFGEGGIRNLEGKTANESLTILAQAIAQLDPSTESDNYWDSTSGNARKSLCDLFTLATLAPPDSVWRVSA